MRYDYEILNTVYGDTLIRSDGAAIPQDPANSDYQAYLRWLNGEEETGTLS